MEITQYSNTTKGSSRSKDSRNSCKDKYRGKSKAKVKCRCKDNMLNTSNITGNLCKICRCTINNTYRPPFTLTQWPPPHNKLERKLRHRHMLRLWHRRKLKFMHKDNMEMFNSLLNSTPQAGNFQVIS